MAHAILGINNRLAINEDSNPAKLKERCVKFQLKLSEWIQQEGEKALDSDVFKSVEGILLNDDPGKKSAMMSSNDFFIGKLLNNGVKKCPDMAKAWSNFGNWCYRFGKKMVESKTDSEGLRPIDFQSIKQLIPEASDDEAEKILNILNQQQITSIDDEDIGPNEMSSTELIENQLKLIDLPFNIGPSKMQEIVDLWKQAHRNVYRYYELSAEAYFKYLQLSCSETAENEDSSVVTATLRLLRLTVKHALGLQEVLEEGLANSPSEPWKVIIPQLFSRLSHHEPYVR